MSQARGSAQANPDRELTAFLDTRIFMKSDHRAMLAR